VFLDYNWEKITNMKKKYGAKVKVSDPGRLGAVLITCETDETDMKRIVKEFGLELIDGYIARSLDCQRRNIGR
jgi:hypothetical protein